MAAKSLKNGLSHVVPLGGTTFPAASRAETEGICHFSEAAANPVPVVPVVPLSGEAAEDTARERGELYKPSELYKPHDARERVAVRGEAPISRYLKTVGQPGQPGQPGQHWPQSAGLQPEGELQKFSAVTIPQGRDADVIDLMSRARASGAVLVGDGVTLVVSARDSLPADLIEGLRDNAGAIIAVLRGEHRARVARRR